MKRYEGFVRTGSRDIIQIIGARRVSTANYESRSEVSLLARSNAQLGVGAPPTPTRRGTASLASLGLLCLFVLSKLMSL